MSIEEFVELLNMFRATMCPSSGADDCIVLSPRVGIVPWLQEGCKNTLAGTVSATLVSVGSNCVCYTCIIWVQLCLLHVYQLGPIVSATRVSFGSNVSASRASFGS